MTDLPGYVWALVCGVAFGIPLAAGVMLHRGARAAGMGPRAAVTMAGVCVLLWCGWVAVDARIADAGTYLPRAGGVPWFPLAFLGSLVVALMATRVPGVSRALAAPGTPARLTVPHTLRIAGVAFLIVAALGKLPLIFALPAGLGDMAIGVEAVFLARRLARGEGRRAAVWFNVLGLLDFVVAVTIAFLAGIGPHQYLAVTPSTRGLAMLPLVLIPTSAVPLLSVLHLVSLRRLGVRRLSPPARSWHAEQSSTPRRVAAP